MVQLLRTASMDEAIKGARIVIPYDTYRLYRIERAKSAAEARYADEQAARLHPPCQRCSVALRGPHAPSGDLSRSRRAACPARPDQPSVLAAGRRRNQARRRAWLSVRL